jgi:uncharacterized protein YaiI (UPF0178 family)
MADIADPVPEKPLRTPTSRLIRTLQVLRGFGVAGTRSSSACRRTILSSQATYPLAGDVIASGAHAFDPRSELCRTDNIQEILQMRNFMDGLRTSSVQTAVRPRLTRQTARD